jgi:diguanylate cyclase (GGDEF)-like protein/PAS domain S-box-containing protein
MPIPMEPLNQPGAVLHPPRAGEPRLSAPVAEARTEARSTSLTGVLERLNEAAENASPRLPSEAAHQNRLVQVRLGIASSLFASLRAKHAPTAAHSLRVALGCSSWASMLNIESPMRDEIEAAALLHDIGKIGVPDAILSKASKLSEDEVAAMERHRHFGVDILRQCAASQNLLDVVRYAPAWYDGSKPGFDRAGEDLPPGARMVAIVDAFDAMTTDRVYRRALSRDRALAELFECAGTQFDLRLVKNFCELVSSDHVKFQTAVAGRWLGQLRAECSNQLWTWNEEAANEEIAAASGSVEALFHKKLLESMHDAVIFVDESLRISLWNRAAEQLTGIQADAILHRQWLPSLLDMRDEEGYTIDDADCPVAYTLLSKVPSTRRLTVVPRDGKKITVDAQMIPVLGRDGVAYGATLLLHDASSEVNLEEKVQFLHEKATRDPLTQVGNRAEFDRVLKLFVHEHLERNQPCSLIICDIDHFKRINDTYGHQAGDEALVSFANILRQLWRPGDLVARYGGEEFCILCANCDNATATHRAEDVRRQLMNLPQPSLEGRMITASFGVTEVQHGDTDETMLRRADRALLQAKESGRNCVIQIGAGLSGEEKPPEPRGWFSWLRATPPDLLLERNLITAVPLPVVAEKLRGFVADHHAEIVAIDEDHVVLHLEVQQDPTGRRTADRALPFQIELRFAELRLPGQEKQPQWTRTLIRVAVRPRRNRDRRRRDAIDRARQLVSSVKSYLMAQDYHPKKPGAPQTVEEEEAKGRGWLKLFG